LYPFVVVERDILIDDLSGLLEGGISNMAQSFFFEVTEEVLHGGIVPTVAAPEHGGSDVILGVEHKIRL